MTSSSGIGIDLGGTQIKAAAFDLASGELLARAIRATRDGEAPGDDGFPAFVAEARAAIASLEKQLPEPAVIVGVSAPGLATRDATAIAYMPGRLAGLENLDWTGALQRAHPVPVLNDAHAALMGEIWQGAARDSEDAVLLTLGTGVGGAIVSGGRLLRGHLGRAGHLGHLTVNAAGPPDICGCPGSLEDAVGNATIRERSGGRFETTHDLIDAHRAGDPDATAIWLKSLRTLAAGIASIINAVDPEIVLIGGGIARAGHELFTPLDEFLDQFEWRPGGHRVSIVPATLGEWAGTYGAVHFARQHGQVSRDSDSLSPGRGSG